MTLLLRLVPFAAAVALPACCFGAPLAPFATPPASSPPAAPAPVAAVPSLPPLTPAEVPPYYQRVEGEFGSIVVSDAWAPLPPQVGGLRWGVDDWALGSRSIEVVHYTAPSAIGSEPLPPTPPPGYAIASSVLPMAQNVGGVEGRRWNLMSTTTGSYLAAGQAMAWAYGERHYAVICLDTMNPESMCPDIFASLRPPAP